MYIRSINKIIEQLQNNMILLFKYPNLDVESICLRVYFDASYATNADCTFQLGYIIFPIEKFNKCHPVHWTSYKSRTVCRSVLKREVVAFADSSDLAYAIKCDFQNVLSQTILLPIMTDGLTLFFYVLIKSTRRLRKV